MTSATKFRRLPKPTTAFVAEPGTTYEVQVGDRIIGTVTGSSEAEYWTIKLGIGTTERDVRDSAGTPVSFRTRQHAGDVLATMVERADKGLRNASAEVHLKLAGNHNSACGQFLDSNTTSDAEKVTCPDCIGNARQMESARESSIDYDTSPEVPAAPTHAVGSDGCIAVCGADLCDNDVSSDDLAAAPNPCPDCQRVLKLEEDLATPAPAPKPKGERFAVSCTAGWFYSTLPGSNNGRASSPQFAECFHSMPEAILAAQAFGGFVTTLPTWNGKGWGWQRLAADPARERALQDARELLDAAAGLLTGHSDQVSNLKISGALWRLVDAAAIAADLVPTTDVGLRTFTGRRARLQRG